MITILSKGRNGTPKLSWLACEISREILFAKSVDILEKEIVQDILYCKIFTITKQ